MANHVHMWDYLSVMNALKPRRPYIFTWAPNIRGEMSFVIRMVGGVPIPDDSLEGTKEFNKLRMTLKDAIEEEEEEGEEEWPMSDSP